MFPNNCYGRTFNSPGIAGNQSTNPGARHTYDYLSNQYASSMADPYAPGSLNLHSILYNGYNNIPYFDTRGFPNVFARHGSPAFRAELENVTGPTHTLSFSMISVLNHNDDPVCLPPVVLKCMLIVRHAMSNLIFS
jgi:hypothetical protein